MTATSIRSVTTTIVSLVGEECSAMQIAKRASIAGLALFLALSVSARAAQRVESNVVYGMYSGLALLMDVYFPEKPNGYGIVMIAGSGWHAPLSLDAEPLKARPRRARQALLDKGYTLFDINHRAAPRFRYPAAVEDAQRAVRFIRHHAARYAVKPDRIGAYGGSSGGHLALMLGLLDGKGPGESPIDQQSSKVQTVVALMPPTDFVSFVARREGGIDAVTSFIGIGWVEPQMLKNEPAAEEIKLLREASPVSHVSADDPPILLIHGDKDSVVPINQSEILAAELNKRGLVVNFIRVPGGGHDAAITDLTAVVDWFERHLRGARN